MTSRKDVLSRALGPARDWLGRDYPAVAVDVFRVAVGLLACSYFARLLVEYPEISSPNGLIDHALMQDVHWYTRIGFFHSWTPGWVIIATYLLGFAGAVFVALGERVRWAAGTAFVAAVAAYRWNFVVMYLDDAVVHLMLFWLLLLPAGGTLTWRGWRRGSTEWARWGEVRVSGVAVRLLMINICWAYFIAAAWKLDSILWREGFGLYASMKVEVARMPDFWTPSHLPFLRLSDYLVLIVEPILPVPMLSPRRWLRFAGAIGFVGFNLFILTTLGIAWAILGMTCSAILFLGEDVAELWRKRFGASTARDVPLPQSPAHRWRRADRVAIGFLAVLCLATARHIPVFGALNQPAYAALWMVGVAQDYRLFNWIDRVAYQVRTSVDVSGPDGSALPTPRGAYPDRFRAKLLQAYAHDIRWLLLPDDRRFELRLAIAHRQASWFCRFVDEPGTRVEITSTIHPVQPDNLDLARFIALRLAEFECVEAGSVTTEEGGVPVPAGWPHLQARFIQGLNRLD